VTTSVLASVLAVGAASGCTFGIGPPSAADHVAGRGMQRFVASSNQKGVPSGYVRGRWDVFDQWRSPIGLHGGVRKGWVRGGLAGRDATGGELDELHWDLTVPLLPGTAIGLSYLWSMTNLRYSDGATISHDARGWAGRLSYAPLPVASVDLMFGKVGGPLTFAPFDGVMDTPANSDVSRLALGVTLRPLPIAGVRIDVNRCSGDLRLFDRPAAWGTWGVSVEGVLTLW